MIKEYTGQKEFTCKQFEIEFHTRYLEWLKGGKVGVDPRTLIEHRPNTVWEWSNCDLGSLMRGVGGQFRWKPAPKRMVTIGWYSLDENWISKTLVAPELEAPAQGTSCYCSGYCGIAPFQWNADMKEYLDNGLVFLRKEDARAMADWLAVCRRGGAV